jgi:hypothetical protein
MFPTSVGPLQNKKNRVFRAYTVLSKWTYRLYFSLWVWNQTRLTLNPVGLNAEINSGNFYKLYSGFVMLTINSRTSTPYYRKLLCQETNKAWRAEGLCLPTVRPSHTLCNKQCLSNWIYETWRHCIRLFFPIILHFDNKQTNVTVP